MTYDNGTSNEITSGYTCIPTKLNEEGNKEITVTYEGKTAKFNVNVQKVKLTGIEITTIPTKTTYTEGETFNKAGMKITARYNDSRKDKVLADNSYTITPNRALETSDKKVTISYAENGETKSIDQSIIVNAKETQEPEIQEYKLGDASGDGVVDFKDMLVINKHRLGKEALTGKYLEAADVTKDGQVDFKDMLRINKYRLGKTSTL